jgi:hypothetical protein
MDLPNASQMSMVVFWVASHGITAQKNTMDIFNAMRSSNLSKSDTLLKN